MTISNRAISITLYSIILLACFVWRADAAIILAHPLDQKGTEGSSVEFMVEAAGENAEYQWIKDGEDIIGATAATYSIDNIALEESGSWFRCRVSLDGVSETSLEAQLIVYSKGDYDWDNDIDGDDLGHLRRHIGKHLGRKYRYYFLLDDFADHHSKGKGAKPYWTKWEWGYDKHRDHHDELSEDLQEFDWNDDNRINGKDLQILRQNCTTTDCEVIEEHPPVIILNPESQQVAEGHHAAFWVGAVGPELRYQWQKNGQDIKGANHRFLLLHKIAFADDGSRYRCVVSNGDGTRHSRESIIHVSRRADVDGDGDVDRDDLLKVESFLGKHQRKCPECNQNKDRKITRKDLERVAQSCDVEDCAEESLPQPLIIRQPWEQQIIAGDSATFTIAAVGDELNFQWFRDDQPIADATQRSYTIEQGSLSDNGARFFCRISSGDVAVDSDVAVLHVYRQGDFDWDGDIDGDDIRVVKVLLYKPFWLYPEANFDNNFQIDLADLRHLIRLCSCPVCQEPEPPVITKEPEDTVVLEKTAASFTVQATGIRLHYQWLVDGEIIPGATDSVYVLESAELLDHGKHFSCIVSSAGGSATTREALLEVEMDVPENTVVVEGLHAAWQQDKALVSWQETETMRYQIHRGTTADGVQLLIETEQPSYLDSGAAYYFGWYYRIATIKDYVHPVSGKVYHAIGPLSESVFLAAQPASSIQLDNIAIRDDGSYQAYYIAGRSISGSYTNMVDPVKITATGGATVTVDGESGHFTLTLPTSGTWQISAQETAGFRTAELTLQLDADTTPPELILQSPEQMSTTDTMVTIVGEAHDSGSGVQSVRVASNQYGSDVTGIVDQNGLFQIEVPVKTGENLLTVIALDNSGNQAQAGVNVEVSVPALPQLTITSPADGAEVETATIDVAGTVRSSLPPEQIRLVFQGQIYFPEGAGGTYSFTFPGVELKEGENLIEVTAETVYGSISDQVFVTYNNPDNPDDPEDPEDPEDGENQPPRIEVYSPKPESYLAGTNVTVSGIATGDTAITSVLVGGLPADISGEGARVSFRYDMDFGAQQQLPITVIATDSEGQSSSLSFTVYHDDGAPVITVDNALQSPPAVNMLTTTPLHLSGSVTDGNLGGFTINGKTVSLLPVGQAAYSFSADLNLVRGQQSSLTLIARDKAGNSSSLNYTLLLNGDLDINIVRPLENAEIYTEEDSVDLEVSCMIPGLKESDTVAVAIDGNSVDGLERNNTTIAGIAKQSLADGDHTLSVTVTSQAGATLASVQRSFSVVDLRLVPLALVRQDPANSETGAQNNSFIGFYFNKPVDPALLSVQVRETYHGKGYGEAPQGADLTSLGRVEMVDIHRDLVVVPGSLSHFPANSMVAFYPERNFAFGAKIYTTLSYNGNEFANTSFEVKPLPTFVQGFIADQFNEPIEGLTVSIPDLNLSTVTDKEGSYSFGFGDGEAIPPGRFLAVANPAMADPRFGSMEFYVTVESGRLNEMGVNNIAIINPEEPFRPIASGMSQAILAGGELTLDLSAAELSFSGGSDSGVVHAQFMSVDQQPYGFVAAAAPQWVFHLNPTEVTVSGNVGVRIKMPAMVGTYEYIEYIGDRVVLVGLDSHSLKIAPVGVGRVDVATRTVKNEGPTAFQRLDIIGYSLVDPEKQPLLEAYGKGEMDLSQLIIKLNQ